MLVINARFLTQPITGVQRFAIELSTLLKTSFPKKIIFVAPHNIIHHDLAEKLDVQIIGTHTGHLWEQLDLPLYLTKQNNPLLLCLCNTAPILYSNKISTVHDITFIRYPKTYSINFNLFYKFIIPRILRTSKHIFTVSNFSKKEIQTYYKIHNHKISVIYNAVNKVFKSNQNQKLSKNNYILAVSSIKENKNFLMVYESFILAQKEIPDLYLYIIGDLNNNNFNNQEKLIKELHSHPQIKILGRITDNELIKYYSNAKAFIFPSFYEGFGIPVLEAQACGCPVIAANSSSLPEVLNNSAIMCNPNNKEEFADAIIKLNNKQKLIDELRNNGYKNVCRFSWERSCNNIIDTIKFIDNESFTY